MKGIQNDVYDEFAMVLFPKMMDILKKNKAKYFKEGSKEMKILDEMADILNGYNGDVSKDSKSALIYNYWFANIVDSMFTTYFKDEFERQEKEFMNARL